MSYVRFDIGRLSPGIRWTEGQASGFLDVVEGYCTEFVLAAQIFCAAVYARCSARNVSRLIQIKPVWIVAAQRRRVACLRRAYYQNGIYDKEDFIAYHADAMLSLRFIHKRKFKTNAWACVDDGRRVERGRNWGCRLFKNALFGTYSILHYQITTSRIRLSEK